MKPPAKPGPQKSATPDPQKVIRAFVRNLERLGQETNTKPQRKAETRKS